MRLCSSWPLGSLHSYGVFRHPARQGLLRARARTGVMAFPELPITEDNTVGGILTSALDRFR